MSRTHMIRISAASAAFWLALTSAIAGGPPTPPPPGPIGPSGPSLGDVEAELLSVESTLDAAMVDLAAVEPRTDIATLSGDASNHFIITQPGSYILTADQDLNGIGVHGVLVQADHVTIDLNGFRLNGALSNNAYGVWTGGADRVNVTVRNGSITDWQLGAVRLEGRAHCAIGLAVASCGSGITLGTDNFIDDAFLISGCRVSSIGGDAISTKACSVIVDTAVGDCIRGISAGTGSVVRACTVDRASDDGIETTGRSVVSECAAWEIDAKGFDLSAGTVARRCTVTEGATFGQIGFESTQSLLHLCDVTDRTGTAFELGSRNCLFECSARGAQAGIDLLGSGNRIDGCQVWEHPNNTGTLFGVRASAAATRCMVVRCTVVNSLSAYQNGAGVSSLYAPVRATMIGAGPWDNFEQ